MTIFRQFVQVGAAMTPGNGTATLMLPGESYDGKITVEFWSSASMVVTVTTGSAPGGNIVGQVYSNGILNVPVGLSVKKFTIAQASARIYLTGDALVTDSFWISAVVGWV